MLVSLKLNADFLKGCAGRGIGQLLFATHPYHPGIRKSSYASTIFVAGTLSIGTST